VHENQSKTPTAMIICSPMTALAADETLSETPPVATCNARPSCPARAVIRAARRPPGRGMFLRTGCGVPPMLRLSARIVTLMLVGSAH
jgi:hypothetical protein